MMEHSLVAIESVKGSTWDLDGMAERLGWEGVDIGYGTHRDSEVLFRSNRMVIEDELTKRFGQYDGWTIATLNHWAVGWVEYIVFDTGRADIKEYFKEVEAKFENYPVLDEALYSQLEWEENHPDYNDECYSDDEHCPCGRRKV